MIVLPLGNSKSRSSESPKHRESGFLLFVYFLSHEEYTGDWL